MKHFLTVFLFAFCGCGSFAQTSSEKPISFDLIGRQINGLPCDAKETNLGRFANQHNPNQIDSLIKQVCNGYQKVLLLPGDGRKLRLPTSITVNSSKVSIGNRIRVGMTEDRLVDEVEKIIGIKPLVVSGKILLPLNDERPETDLLSLEVIDGRLAKVTWDWSVD